MNDKAVITKKKCSYCGWERRPEDPNKDGIPPTQCPICRMFYEPDRKRLEIVREEKLKLSEEEIEIEAQRERYRRHHEECKQKEIEERKEVEAHQERYRRDLQERERKEREEREEDNSKVGGMKLEDLLEKYFIYIFMAAFFIAYLVFGTWSDVSYTKGWDEISWTRKGILGW